MSVLTLQTELQTLRQNVTELGTGAYHTALLQGLDNLEPLLADADAHPLPVVVFLGPGLPADELNAFAASLGISAAEIQPGASLTRGNYVFRFQDTMTPLPVVLGIPQASLGIALVKRLEDLQSPLLRYLKLLRVYASQPEEGLPSNWPAGLQTVRGDHPIQPKDAQGWLDQVCDQTGGQALRDHALTQSLEQIALLNRDNIVQENKLIQLRKALQTQLGQAVKLEEGSFNASELGSQTRSRIQNSLAELEKSIKQQWEDANKPQTGAFFHRSSALAEELEQLEEIENLEKTEKVTLRPAPEFEEQFQSQVQATLAQRFEIDAGLIQRTIGKLTEELNHLFTQHQVAALPASEDFRRRFAFQKITDSFAAITKSYQGEMTKRGFTEYFVALREYTSLISTVVGLLMPIVIGIGGFEVLDEFVLKNKEQPQQIAPGMVPGADAAMMATDPAKKPSRWESMSFSQKLRTVVYTLSAFISIAMLVYGFYTLSHRIPQMRQEVYQRELRKARDSLLSEGRRMFNEAGREWLGQVSNFCREQSTAMQNAAERSIKDQLQQRDKKLTESKNAVQRRSQGVDLLQRRLSAVDRAKDQSVQNIAQLRRALDQSIEQHLKRLASA
jgi:hypothetical protein